MRPHFLEGDRIGALIHATDRIRPDERSSPRTGAEFAPFGRRMGFNRGTTRSFPAAPADRPLYFRRPGGAGDMRRTRYRLRHHPQLPGPPIQEAWNKKFKEVGLRQLEYQKYIEYDPKRDVVTENFYKNFTEGKCLTGWLTINSRAMKIWNEKFSKLGFSPLSIHPINQAEVQKLTEEYLLAYYTIFSSQENPKCNFPQEFNQRFQALGLTAIVFQENNS